SRSRNIRFTFVIQNFSQLNKVYGKDVAETIKGTCGNFVYIMSTELAALEEISKLLGDKKPEKPKKDEPAPPIRPLFTVSDLQALKQNEVIFNRFRSMPFKTKLTPNWQIDWGKKYEDMGYTTRPKREIKVFDLVDALSKRDIKKAHQILYGMQRQNEPIIKTLGLIAGHFRRLFFSKINKNKTNAELATQLGCKEYAISKAKQQAELFTASQLKNIENLILETDYNIKSGNMAQENGLYYLIFSIVNM
ncbi:MAG: TraM recognition domain-containing protein, partial [Clostridia bacterium]|nr:TraM recognition domain-containing protein [Clostridia bacterium]